MFAGMSTSGWAYMIINQPGGKREVYADNFFGSSGQRTETASVKEDQLCVGRDSRNSNTQEERCHDVYHVGGDRYETLVEWSPALDLSCDVSEPMMVSCAA